MKNKIYNVGIITVKSNSARLQNKCFYKFKEKFVIEHVVVRLKYYNIDHIRQNIK